MIAFLKLRPAQAMLVTVGIVAGMIAWNSQLSSIPRKTPVAPARAQAWAKIEKHLANSGQSGAEGSERHLQRVKDFFADKRGHANDFAEDVLGWGGKWAFVKGKISGDKGQGHQAHMRQCFERHLFTDRDIQELLESIVLAYLSELEGEENALLVQIQADLSEEDLPALRALGGPHNSGSFRTEYQKMMNQVVPLVGRDLTVTVGREAVVWVGSDIASAVTVRIASAVAVRLGISGGILGTGAASGAATLGIGLVVGFIVDGAVDWGMRKAGYDPTAQIVRELSATLVRVENLVIDGDPEAHGTLHKLRHLQERDAFAFVRAECRKGADRLEDGGSLGLRHELNRLRQVRSRLREEALKKLVLEGGNP